MKMKGFSGHIFHSLFICFSMDWRLIVPEEKGWSQVDFSRAMDVRLRPGAPAMVTYPDGIWRGCHPLTPDEITRAAQALSGFSLAAWKRELSQGFLPLPGGNRLGVCGVMGENGVREITSLCVRLAHEAPGAGKDLFQQIKGQSALIAGPPGSGKTTLLRDLVRLYSESGVPVGVADERGEIAACQGGAPQLNVGPMTDVVSFMEKGKALMLLIRAMAPRVAAADEIGSEEDARGILEAALCGVTVLATAHGSGEKELFSRPGLSCLLRQKAFQQLVFLKKPGARPRIVPLEEG